MLVGALHWTDPIAAVDPQAVALAYLRQFEARRALRAGQCCNPRAGWRVLTADGPVTARDAVIALGPWADAVTRGLGYDLPLAVKRGYHMHYRAAGRAVLNHPMLDTERGYSRRCAAASVSPRARSSRCATG